MRNSIKKASNFVACASLATILVGCDENGKFALGTAGGQDESVSAPAEGSTAGAIERDVEAPDVFSALEAGLWDGRPSLGGVWVAHPDVKSPERVIIRNNLNGRSVIGALFRRERDNPGPALQVSSDAANELGLLAGSSTELNVVALRKEEISQAIPQAVSEFDEPIDVGASDLTPLAPQDVEDVASTALDAIVSASVAPKPSVAKPSSTPAARTLKKPFVQIGIFSVEANAIRNGDRLRASGISTQVLAQKSRGKAFWRVLVGPAPTTQDRAEILKKVKALGFSDAYFVTN